MIKEYLSRLFGTKAERKEKSSLEKDIEFYKQLHKQSIDRGHYGSSMRRRSMDITEKAYVQYTRDITG